VGEALERAGYTVHRQVGTSRFRIDLAIVDPRQPGRYVLGIECDGKTYHQSKTARDRDRLRQEILEGLGWHIHRIWSTEWIHHPGRELDRVIARVSELLEAEPHNPRGRGSDASAIPVDYVSVPEWQDVVETAGAQSRHDGRGARDDAAPPIHGNPAVPYRVSEPPVVGYGDILNTPLTKISAAIRSCVDIEGPIHRDLLVRRITAAWGYQRAGTRIATRVGAAIDSAVGQGLVRKQGAFVWPAEPSQRSPQGQLHQTDGCGTSSTSRTRRSFAASSWC